MPTHIEKPFAPTTPARSSRLPVLVAAVMTLTPSAPLLAEAFRTPYLGTYGLGSSGGKIAFVDDSSAIVHNPANLVNLDSAEIALAPTIVYFSADYESSSGQTTGTKEPWNVLPNLFAATPLANTNVVLGIGVNTPFGLSINWKNEGAFADTTTPFSPRYQAPYSAELKTININPTCSVRLGEHFSVGVGLDCMWTQLTLEQYYPWFVLAAGAPEGAYHAKGDGWGFGGNLGVTWRPHERHRLAVTYRSQIALDYRGDFSITDPSGFLLGAAGGSPSSSFATDLTLPNIVGLAYGMQITSNLTVEANAEWLSYSLFKSLDLDYGVNNGLFPPNTLTLRQDWNDSFTAGLGAVWKPASAWVLRAGYDFNQSPVPDYTFTPTIPDSNAHVVSVGAGFRTGHHSIEVSYGVFLYESREIERNQTPAFIGEYTQHVHLVGLHYRFVF